MVKQPPDAHFTVLLYRDVFCRSCKAPHQLYIVLVNAERNAVRQVRYQCPDSGDVLGVKLRGVPEAMSDILQQWIECAPLFD